MVSTDSRLLMMEAELKKLTSILLPKEAPRQKSTNLMTYMQLEVLVLEEKH